jgi:hypothetical protein
MGQSLLYRGEIVDKCRRGGLVPRKTYYAGMAIYKVSEICFKEESGEIEKVITREANAGWSVVTLSTYSKNVDHTNKAHAVIVFTK